MAADVEGDVYVLVEHPFEYTGKDGRRVAIRPNERYRLLRRSTEHWWHVRSEPGGRPFYLPAQYVRELPALGHPATPPHAPLPGPTASEPLAYDYRFVSASAPAGPDGTPAEPRDRAGSLCSLARGRNVTQRRSLAPGLPACLYTRPTAPVRPAQSLDDLARTAVPPAGLLGSRGSFKACSVAGSWVCPRPLARSDSENVYEAIQDVRGQPREQHPKQVRHREPGAGRRAWRRARSPGTRALGDPFSLASSSTEQQCPPTLDQLAHAKSNFPHPRNERDTVSLTIDLLSAVPKCQSSLERKGFPATQLMAKFDLNRCATHLV